MSLGAKMGAMVAVAALAAVGLGACSSSSSKSVASTTSTSAPKKSAAALAVSPNSDLVNMQSVNVTGSGFAASSEGNILECNGDPKQPTVALPAPVSSKVSVGCSAPSLSAVVGTSSSGTLSTSYKVVQGTVGPPCGSSGALVAQCPATDSAGASPATDAAAYPCPPTPAQQAAGVICVLTFGDAAGNTASAPISFAGEKAS
jgi:hypothetical protein